MLIIYITISILSIIPTLAEFQPDISAYGADAFDACEPIDSDPVNKRKHIRKCRDYLVAKRKFNEASRLDLDYGLDDPINGVGDYDIMNFMNVYGLKYVAHIVHRGDNPNLNYPRGRHLELIRQADSRILLVAIEQGDLKFLQHLLESGIDPNPATYHDTTDYIMVAQQKGHAEMVSMLIKYGAVTRSPNDISSGRDRDLYYKRDKLMGYVSNGDNGGVIDLLKEGVPATASRGGYTALETAIENSDLPMVQILMDGGFNFEAKKMRSLHTALANIEILDYLWPRIIHQDQVDNLFEAACLKFQDTRLLDYLLKKGANINGKSDRKFTPLMYSIVNHNPRSDDLTYDDPTVFDYLIEKGVDLEVKNSMGMTAVMMAAAFGMFNFFTKLIDADANLEAVANDGKTLRERVESAEEGKYWKKEEALQILQTKGL